MTRQTLLFRGEALRRSSADRQVECAIREVQEELGMDLSQLLNERPFGSELRCDIFSGSRGGCERSRSGLMGGIGRILLT